MAIHASLACAFCVRAAPRRARMTSVAIKGDVEGIVRRPGATEVLVAEGLGSSAYALDELLVDFGAALEDLVSWPAVVGGCMAAGLVNTAHSPGLLPAGAAVPCCCSRAAVSMCSMCTSEYCNHLAVLQPARHRRTWLARWQPWSLLS